MLSFEHFRSRRRSFQPRTPASALRAVTEGFADVEELVYQGTSIKPLVEEPYDLLELQRLLSREELDLSADELLVGIFGRMLSDPDPERVLFAAEGITTIETRYARRINELKELVATEPDAPALLELARRYYELGMLNDRSPSLRSFYLREAFLAIRDRADSSSLPLDVLSVAVRILTALGLADQAESVLARAEEPLDPEVLYFRAELAFMRKDYATLSVLMRRLASSYNRLREGIRTTIDQWCANSSDGAP